MADETNGTKNGADVAVDAFGVKANVKNVKSLNTLATVATLILVAAALPFAYSHVTKSEDRDIALVTAMNAMAEAQRVAYCINSYKEAEREHKVDHCKRISK